MGLESISIDSMMGFISTVVLYFGAFLALWGAVGMFMSFKDNQGMSMDANAGRFLGGLGIMGVSGAFKLVTSASAFIVPVGIRMLNLG